MRPALLSVALLLVATIAGAGGYGDLYDDATLQKWQPVFAEDIVWNYRNAILPKLTPEEKERLRNVRIEFPLRGPEEDVFEFFAGNGKVVLPVLSLRFFGDLALASAWLNENQYNGQTVSQYVGMIHFRRREDFPGRRYPDPLTALRIPGDARNDPAVADAFGKVFSSGVIFILCHELGHLVHEHPGYAGVSAQQAQLNEAQADRFAVEIMRRLGVVPAGIVLWFANTATREAEGQKGARTHPLSAARIESLAAGLEKAAPDFARAESDPARAAIIVRTIAAQVRTIAGVLGDEEIHRMLRHQGATTGLKDLAPRRTIELAAPQGAGSPAGVPFDGVYHCRFKAKVSRDVFDLRLVLRRHGDKVTGEYTYAIFSGKVLGFVRGQTLDLAWTEGGATGKARFQSDQSGGSFTGTWGDATSPDNGGTWSGKRQ